MVLQHLLLLTLVELGRVRVKHSVGFVVFIDFELFVLEHGGETIVFEQAAARRNGTDVVSILVDTIHFGSFVGSQTCRENSVDLGCLLLDGNSALAFGVELLLDLLLLEVVVREGLGDSLCLAVQAVVHEETVHVRPKHLRTDQVRHTELFQLFSRHESVIVVQGVDLLLLHFLCQVFEERAPTRRRA